MMEDSSLTQGSTPGPEESLRTGRRRALRCAAALIRAARAPLNGGITFHRSAVRLPRSRGTLKRNRAMRSAAFGALLCSAPRLKREKETNLPGLPVSRSARERAHVGGGDVRTEGYEELELPQKVGLGGGGWAETSLQEKSFGAGTPDSLPERERPPLRHIDKYVRAELPCLSKRYTVAVLTCVGFMISFGMRCNMAMAKLQFQKINVTDETEADHGLGVLNNVTSTAAHLPTGREMPHQKWSVATESMVDSSFFWGYLVTQVPGGFLASKYPATRIFGLAIVTSSVLNLLVPGATEIHPSVVILVRICQGLVE
ncbi:Vesicular glutamate transporter 1, partial [Frankliniella fusca]